MARRGRVGRGGSVSGDEAGEDEAARDVDFEPTWSAAMSTAAVELPSLREVAHCY